MWGLTPQGTQLVLVVGVIALGLTVTSVVRSIALAVRGRAEARYRCANCPACAAERAAAGAPRGGEESDN